METKLCYSSRKKKAFKFDIIRADMNTALELINSPSSAAGPER